MKISLSPTHSYAPSRIRLQNQIPSSSKARNFSREGKKNKNGEPAAAASEPTTSTAAAAAAPAAFIPTSTIPPSPAAAAPAASDVLELPEARDRARQ
ncbi:hypothetical protein J5N97_020524 [Dioscorea zingiberensis]|uniref:Uncharacterized protein n=1 Tax=Dioscorea zingiberensis TaxID=325984 RepID=A0A9D5CI63_9LILI|nr:hypothetical protein J5N97_020524 [Dioscorea zingiberensis]